MVNQIKTYIKIPFTDKDVKKGYVKFNYRNLPIVNNDIWFYPKKVLTKPFIHKAQPIQFINYKTKYFKLLDRIPQCFKCLLNL